jgi:NAD-dependent SIR2 family protein deacetylase
VCFSSARQQNIDTLERKAGIEQVVYCHGSFATATCTRCSKTVEGDEIQADIKLGRVPICQHRAVATSQRHGARQGGGGCIWPAHEGGSSSSAQTTSSGASSPSSEEHEEDAEEEEEGEWRRHSEKLDSGVSASQVCGGVLKPDIVMFNEQLPREFEDCLTQDIPQADLLLVMGTSLSVAPVAHIPMMLRHIPSIMINAEPVMAHGVWDVLVQGACDDAIRSMRLQGLEESILGPPRDASPAMKGGGDGGAAAFDPAQPHPSSTHTPPRPLLHPDPAYRAFASCGESPPTSYINRRATIKGGEEEGGGPDRWWTWSSRGTDLGDVESANRTDDGKGSAELKGRGKRARVPAESREVDVYEDAPRIVKRGGGERDGQGRHASGKHKISRSFAHVPTMAALNG